MIEPDDFSKLWVRLCRRFGRQVDHEEAMDYLGYLERSGMTWPEVEAEAEALWATREFFPRPADFFGGQEARGWREILTYAGETHRHSSSIEQQAARARIPARALRALSAIGGVDAVRATAPERIAHLRRDYAAAFAAVVVESSVDRALPAAAARVEIGAGELAHRLAGTDVPAPNLRIGSGRRVEVLMLDER